jgi:hypothetical protein
MNLRKHLFLFAALGCAGAAVTTFTAEAADANYPGGHITTGNDAAPAADALAVSERKIFAGGTEAGVLLVKGPRPR